MGTLIMVVYPKTAGSDPYTVAREAVDLSKRLAVTLSLQVTPSYSLKVDADSDERALASDIMNGRSIHRHSGQQ